MKNKYLQIRKESIFTRVVGFIKRIFGKEVEQEILDQVETAEKKEVKSNFFNEISIYKEENEELLNLQSKYENNEIDLRVLSNEEIHELNLLYKRQISDLKEKLDDKKTQLAMMKNRIKSHSANM